MQILDGLKVSQRFLSHGIYSALRYLEEILVGVHFPDVEGIQVKSLSGNLTEVTDGHFAINVTQLETPVRIGGEENPVSLMKHASKYFFQFAEKAGVPTSPTLRLERAEIMEYLLAVRQSRTDGKRFYEGKGWTDGLNQATETTIDGANSSNYQIVESSGVYSLQPLVVADPFQVTTTSTIVQYTPIEGLLIMEVIGWPVTSFQVAYSLDDGATFTTLDWAQSRAYLYGDHRINITNWALPSNSAVRLTMRITSPGGQSFQIFGWRASLA